MAQNVATAARKSGPFAAPLFDPASAAAILRDIDQGAERVRLAALSPRLGLTPKAQNTMIREHLLAAERLGGRGNPYAITRDDARTLLLAALLAVAAGVAIAVMFRGLINAGVTGKTAAEVLVRVAVPT
jgi:hypothetical protein